jgi:hypothetical protein
MSIKKVFLFHVIFISPFRDHYLAFKCFGIWHSFGIWILTFVVLIPQLLPLSLLETLIAPIERGFESLTKWILHLGTSLWYL